MENGPGELGPDDVATLNAMTRVSLAAAGRATGGGRDVGRDVEVLTDGVARSISNARAAVGGLEVLGDTRFAAAKRAVLRAARLVTHRLVEADRHLADGLEGMAVVQREQVGYARRMNASLRALVVSADLATAEALEELRAGVAEVTAAAERLERIEARLAALEARTGAQSDAPAGEDVP